MSGKKIVEGPKEAVQNAKAPHEAGPSIGEKIVGGPISELVLTRPYAVANHPRERKP